MEENKKVSGLARLRAPFEDHQISLLPKPYKKENPKGNCSECGGYHGLPAAHLKYVGHAALTDRLLEVDENWNWEPLAFDEQGLPRLDKSGGLWIKLTVCGLTRLGYGNAETSQYKEVGSREKELIGDALRNAGMRFGAALDLWHKGDLHLDDDGNGTNPRLPDTGVGGNDKPVPIKPRDRLGEPGQPSFGVSGGSKLPPIENSKIAPKPKVKTLSVKQHLEKLFKDKNYTSEQIVSSAKIALAIPKEEPFMIDDVWTLKDPDLATIGSYVKLKG